MNLANNLKVKGSGFEADTNIVTMITPGSVTELELMSKDDVATLLVNHILELRQES